LILDCTVAFSGGQPITDRQPSLGNSTPVRVSSTPSSDENSSRKSIIVNVIDVHPVIIAQQMDDRSQLSMLPDQLQLQAHQFHTTFPNATDYSPPTDFEIQALPQSDFSRPTIAWMTSNRASDVPIDVAKLMNNNGGQLHDTVVDANISNQTTDVGKPTAVFPQPASRMAVAASNNSNSRLPVPVKRGVTSINQTDRTSDSSSVLFTLRQQAIPPGDYDEQRAALTLTPSKPAAPGATSDSATSAPATKSIKVALTKPTMAPTTRNINDDEQVTMRNVTKTMNSSPTSGIASFFERGTLMTTTLAHYDEHANAGHQPRLRLQSRQLDKCQETCCQSMPVLATPQRPVKLAKSQRSTGITKADMNLLSWTGSDTSFAPEATEAVNSKLSTEIALSSSTLHSLQPSDVMKVTSAADERNTINRMPIHRQLRQSLPSANSSPKLAYRPRKLLMAVRKLPSVLSSTHKNSAIDKSPNAVPEMKHPYSGTRPAQKDGNNDLFHSRDEVQSDPPRHGMQSRLTLTTELTESVPDKTMLAVAYLPKLHEQDIERLSSDAKVTIPAAKPAATVGPFVTPPYGASLTENQELDQKVVWSSPVNSAIETKSVNSAKLNSAAAADSNSSNTNSTGHHYAMIPMSQTIHVDHWTAPKQTFHGHSTTAGDRISSERSFEHSVASNTQSHPTDRIVGLTTTTYMTPAVTGTMGANDGTHTAANSYPLPAYETTQDTGRYIYPWEHNTLHLSHPLREQIEAQTAADSDQVPAFHSDHSSLDIDRRNPINQSNNIADEQGHVSLLQAPSAIKSIVISETPNQSQLPEMSVISSSSANQAIAAVPSDFNDGRFFDRNNRASRLRTVATKTHGQNQSFFTRSHTKVRRTVAGRGIHRPSADADAAKGHYETAQREAAGLTHTKKVLIEESNEEQAFTSQPEVVKYSYDTRHNRTREQRTDNNNDCSIPQNSCLWSAVGCTCNQPPTCDVQNREEHSRNDMPPNWDESQRELPRVAVMEGSNEGRTMTSDERSPCSKTTFIVQHHNRHHRSIVSDVVKPPSKSTPYNPRKSVPHGSRASPENMYCSRRLRRR
jgi:hypothetical protein